MSFIPTWKIQQKDIDLEESNLKAFRRDAEVDHEAGQWTRTTVEERYGICWDPRGARGNLTLFTGEHLRNHNEGPLYMRVMPGAIKRSGTAELLHAGNMSEHFDQGALPHRVRNT